MKKILYSLCVVSLLLSITGCTQNNGNIGNWFGQWRMDSYKVNGEVQEDYQGNIFFCFQSAVFAYRYSKSDGDYSSAYLGKWEEWEEKDGDLLVIIFNTEESNVPPNNPFGFKAGNVLKVVHNGGSEKTLTYEDEEGNKYEMHFVAW